MNLAPIYIEKDYWVTFALHAIFHDEIGKKSVFKGGTALSKCYGIIERFSEDIDLVVLKKDIETSNQLKSKLKKITNIVANSLTEVDEPTITNKRGMIRKVAFNYPKVFTGVFGQVRQFIIIEASWLGRSEPYTKQVVSSYIFDMMSKTGQEKLAKENGMMPFEVQVLHVNRTICEKIMSLVRFSYGENPIEDLKKKIRHTYDLYQLLSLSEVQEFFESSAFDNMLQLVANDDVESFKNDNSWLKNHPKDALIFRESDNTWAQMENTYLQDFRNLVYGKLPPAEDILKTLKVISNRIQNIDWKIDFKDSL
jgi:hypothetical protein